MSMMDDYMTILGTLYQTPNEYFRGLSQAYLTSQWDNTTLLETVKEETQRGSFEFSDIDAWKDGIVDFTTNALKDEKNYRKLMFENCNHEVDRGRFYYFDDNYWLVYAPTTPIELYSDISVRRCNNIAKWIDPDTNVIHELPCILEYDDSSSRERIDKDITTPNNSVILILQGNNDTIQFAQNKRFIFNGRPFMISGYNNYMQDDYVTKDTPLLFFDIYLDEILPTDDMINGIANRYEYNYQVDILESPIENINGFSGQLTANVLLNGKNTNKTVTWSANSNATIDVNGNYTLNGTVGSVATLTATYGSSTDSVSINIVSSIVNNREIVVTPNTTTLRQGRSVTFTASLYSNGVVQSDVITATVGGADSNNNYTWVSLGGNQFTLTNNLRSVSPLVITFTSGTTTKVMNIVLGAML